MPLWEEGSAAEADAEEKSCVCYVCNQTGGVCHQSNPYLYTLYVEITDEKGYRSQDTRGLNISSAKF